MYYGHLIIICNMPLARKLRKKKTLFCAFEPDHYDNKLQSYLTLARACFLKGGSPAKCGFAAFRYLPYAASLDAHGSVQKKKMKLHETAGNENIKQE